MSNHIQNISISNFKSIQELNIDGCKKINVLVGYPNAGKSNILEGISLISALQLGLPLNLKDFIRFDNLDELFFEKTQDGIMFIVNEDNPIFGIIKDNKFSFSKQRSIEDDIEIEINNDGSIKLDFTPIISRKFFIIKKYTFNNTKTKNDILDGYFFDDLYYPFGENLGRIIVSNTELRNSIQKFFVQNNLKLLIEKGTNELKIFKEFEDGTVFTLPYSMIADTLQRLIFYKTAIMSNENSVLLFEEPEAHCFEPYILEFTNAVKYDENNNQYFIVTHSQFVIDELLRDEESRKNTQIYLVNNIDNKTQIKKLNEENNDDVYQYGMNVFFNFENLWQTN